MFVKEMVGNYLLILIKFVNVSFFGEFTDKSNSKLLIIDLSWINVVILISFVMSPNLAFLCIGITIP